MAQQQEAAGQDRVDATARAVIECAADAIVASSTDHTVLLWNPAAERMFGWTAQEVLGTEPPIIPEELKAEHNAVLERIRGGGQVSFATGRARKDGSLLDLRIDTSALLDRTGGIIGWVNVCHRAGEDEAARSHMAKRARVVRKLGDVVADMNAQRDLEAVLDRIAASLCDLTGADAGGVVLIEHGSLRLGSGDGLPGSLRGRPRRDPHRPPGATAARHLGLNCRRGSPHSGRPQFGQHPAFMPQGRAHALLELRTHRVITARSR